MLLCGAGRNVQSQGFGDLLWGCLWVFSSGFRLSEDNRVELKLWEEVVHFFLRNSWA